MVMRAPRFLLLLVIAAHGCGDSKPPPTTPPPAPGPKKADPAVLKLEKEGKKKCEMGMKLVRLRLDSTAESDPDIIRFDLEAACTQFDEGLAAYEAAAKKSGRTYTVEPYRRARERAMTVLCDSLEREGKASCDRGLGMIRRCESLMTGRALTDEERATLRRDLRKGKDLIESGMGMFERSNELTGNTFDTTRYGQAMKAASMKLLELKE